MDPVTRVSVPRAIVDRLRQLAQQEATLAAEANGILLALRHTHRLPADAMISGWDDGDEAAVLVTRTPVGPPEGDHGEDERIPEAGIPLRIVEMGDEEGAPPP